ncbi:MAG: hypothetical protein GXO07_04640 [Crenarchaeota archaeon]|nr:hypothetical protein [Thermoproteota archaeon]
MRRSRLLTVGGIGYMAVLAIAAFMIAMGAAGLLVKVLAAAGALPPNIAEAAKVLPGLGASVTADPVAGQLSSISVSTK